VHADWVFHPGRLVTAIREGYAFVIKHRRAYVTEVHEYCCARELGAMSFWQRFHFYRQLVHQRTVGFFNGDDNKQVSLKNFQTQKQRSAPPGDDDFFKTMAKDGNPPGILHQATQKSKIGRIAQLRRERRKIINAASLDSATVEELQVALMLCEADIVEHRQCFSVLEPPPRDLAEQEGAAVSLSSLLSGSGLLQRSDEKGEETSEAADPQATSVTVQQLELDLYNLHERCEELLAEKQLLLHEEVNLHETLANIPAEKARLRSNASASACGIRHGTSAALAHAEVATEVIVSATTTEQVLAEIPVEDFTDGGPTAQVSKGVAAEGIRGPPRVQIIPNRPSAEHALTEHTADVANVPAQQALSEVSTEGAAVSSGLDEPHEAGVHADTSDNIVNNRTPCHSAAGGSKQMYAPLRAALVPASGVLTASHVGQPPEPLQQPIETL